MCLLMWLSLFWIVEVRKGITEIRKFLRLFVIGSRIYFMGNFTAKNNGSEDLGIR